MLAKEQWWRVISNYKKAILPMQFIVIAIGIFVVGYFLAKQNSKSNQLLKGYFSLCNL